MLLRCWWFILSGIGGEPLGRLVGRYKREIAWAASALVLAGLMGWAPSGPIQSAVKIVQLAVPVTRHQAGPASHPATGREHPGGGDGYSVTGDDGTPGADEGGAGGAAGGTASRAGSTAGPENACLFQ